MWSWKHQAQKKTFPELHIERIDLQLLNNKLQKLYYQEMQKKNNIYCVLILSYHVTLLA